MDSCEGPFENGVLRMTRYQPFVDDALTAGVSVIRAAHIEELRTRIDAVRARWSLVAYTYTDSGLTTGASSIRAQHLVDLRAALSEAYLAAGRPPPTYTDAAPVPGDFVKGVHITELRTAVARIE